jgi:hypothetical protein
MLSWSIAHRLMSPRCLVFAKYYAPQVENEHNPDHCRAAVLFGGGGGYYGYNRYGRRGLGGVLGFVLVIFVVIWFFGGLHFNPVQSGGRPPISDTIDLICIGVTSRMAVAGT